MGRIESSIRDYREKYEDRTDGKGAFFLKDIKELSSFTENERKANGATEDQRSLLFDAIYNALAAGFIIGCQFREQETGAEKK